MKSLVIVTPVRGSNPDTALVTLGFSTFRTTLFPIASMLTCTSYEPVKARNRLAATALQNSSMKHVLWLDDDQWATDATIVQRMIDTGQDLIGAPYTRKGYPLHFVHDALPGAKREGDLLEVNGLGFGFTITSRSCLEEMTRHSRIYMDRPNKNRVGDLFGMSYQEVIPGIPEDDVLLSEDLSFCDRWRKLGHKAILYCGGPGHICHVGGHIFESAKPVNETHAPTVM
jgi:hypothetical protein